MIPALALGLMGVGAGLSSAYQFGRALENRRYWDNYVARHHVKVKYPYRLGYNDYISASGRMFTSIGGMYGAYYNIPRYTPTKLNNLIGYS